MCTQFASKIFLLHLLLVMMLFSNWLCAHGSRGATEMAEKIRVNGETNFLRLPGDDVHVQPKITHAMGDNDAPDQVMQTAHVHSNPSSQLHHMDPATIVFFTTKDLKVGVKMPIFFPNKDPSKSPPILPREEADTIPFSGKELPNLIQFFSFSQGSLQAKAMEDTLRQCEAPTIKGETKICATSLESMLDFVRGSFGLETQYEVVATIHLTRSSALLENYTIIEGPKEIPAPKMVACHSMPYPYAIFYCHSQQSQNKVFLVSLASDNGARVEAVAVCHMDTSQWSHNHVSFHVLGIEPGSSDVCHFFPEDNLVYVPIAYHN